MAKIFALPKGFEKPSLDFTQMDTYNERAKVFTDKLAQWCKDNKSEEHIGKIIKFQVADGYAEYMVASLTPEVELIHLPLMDEYQFEFVDLMTKERVIELIKNQEARERLFSSLKK